jgi:hypothetical protein
MLLVFGPEVVVLKRKDDEAIVIICEKRFRDRDGDTRLRCTGLAAGY